MLIVGSATLEGTTKGHRIVATGPRAIRGGLCISRLFREPLK